MNADTGRILFTNGRIISPEGILDGQDLLFNNGLVEHIAPELQQTGCRHIDLKGKLLAPGLTELHIHGCGSWGFEDIDLDGFRQAADYLTQRGITAAVPTFQWDSKAVKNAAEIIRAYQAEGGRMKVPGIYIEGPFIAPKKKGGIKQSSISAPSAELLASIIEAGGGLIKIMTIAPELPGIEDIAEKMMKADIIPAFGHSNCSLAEAEKLYDFCIARGAVPGMTHLLNASSPLSHRDPGLSMLPFTRNTYFELNADGVHVADPMLKIIGRAASPGRCLLISDALISAGLRDAEKNKEAGFHYYGVEVIPTDRGVRSLGSDILSGSSALIPDVIRHYTETTGTTIDKAIKSASGNASCFLGLAGGGIRTGSITDLAVFNEKMEAEDIYIS